jgi:uncharacterized protein YcbK (DUF882 family)
VIRGGLRLGALAALALGGLAGVARADSAVVRVEPPPAPLSKKEATWQAKQQAGAAPAPPVRAVDRARQVGKPPAPLVSIYNTWTREWVAVDARASALPAPLADRLLRCHFTNQPTTMDRRLAAAVLAAARHFKVDRVHVISGFRAPKYNLMLRKKGRRVATESEHTRGHAVDFMLPGVPLDRLHKWALANAVGGVGKYPSNGFVHMDVGRRRTWVD